MRIERKDLKPLRFPATALLIAVVCAFLLIRYVDDKRSAINERIRTASTEAEQARQRYRDSDQEKAMISQYLPRYRALQQGGFIGTENRVKWIDALRVADQKSGNFGVQYSLGAQAPYSGALSTEPVARRLRQSTMDIRFGVVHEGQLLEFLNALDSQDAGMYTLRSCSIEPRNDGKPQPRTANLTVHCEIDWLTLLPPEIDQS